MDCTSAVECLLSSQVPWGSTQPSLRSEGGADHPELYRERFVFSSQRQQMHKGSHVGGCWEELLVQKSPRAWTWARPSYTTGCSQKWGASELSFQLVSALLNSIGHGVRSHSYHHHLWERKLRQEAWPSRQPVGAQARIWTWGESTICGSLYVSDIRFSTSVSLTALSYRASRKSTKVCVSKQDAPGWSGMS